MKSKSSIKTKILMYLISFSGIILFFLWFFQILLLNFYYEYETRKTMSYVRKVVYNSYEKENVINILDNLSYRNNICIEIVQNNNLLYTSDAMNRGCLVENNETEIYYKLDFISSGKSAKNYKIKNEILGNQTLVYALKLDDFTYAYMNASLDPIDSTLTILSKQFIFVSIGVLILSILISYYLSRRISKPITIMSENVKKLAKGIYEPFEQVTDVKEISELIDTLNYASKELSKTDELRKDLMANVSHDLKTPLTMIKAYAEMNRDLNIKDKNKIKDNLNVIIEESDRLNLLVNDILELSKNESNIKQLEIEEFDLNLLIKTILKRYDIYKEKEGYNFIYTNNKKIIIKADKSKIEQVIYNLINNAMNYTGKDKTVEIIIKEEKEGIKVLIKDTGKGIDKDKLNNIWEKYYTTNKNYKRNIIGTGLGLPIVKSILEKHKFKYGVESKKGKGTTFYFIVQSKNIIS